jgi:pSer/pThr/pTyr-binding forkhead associated (FHA) protein
MPLGGPPQAYLVIHSPHNSWEMKLDQLPCRIGRRDPKQQHYPELDLAEHDRGIASRQHATIHLSNDVYTLTDLGSTNGTMINEVRIPPHVPHQLRPGDHIRVGEVDMEFRWS